MTPQNEYFSTSQAARALGFGERTVKSFLDSGALPSIQPTGRAGRRYVSSTDLLEFAQKHGIPCYLENAV